MSDIQKIYSPNKQLFVILSSYEIRMSHWVTTASLWETTPDREVLSFGNAWWSTDQVTWREDSACVMAELRRYPGDVPAMQIDIYPEQRVINLHAPTGIASIPFEGLEEYLEAHYRRYERRVPARTKRT